MQGILKKICNKKIEELEYAKIKCSLQSLKKLLPAKDNRNFKELLQSSQINKKTNIIAEIKKSSPSAGEIIKDYQPEKIAIEYEKSGAGALSILTEKFFFNGQLDHLSLLNKKSNLPILRKDFILDEYQIFESKVFKADAILLIASILDDTQINEFIDLADKIGLDCIIETHSPEELERAMKINYPIIGINNRNLNSLNVNINNTVNLIKQVPKHFTIIGESGIKNYSDIEIYNQNGVYNFLIGESLLKSQNIDIKFKELLK
tara:strand:- start:1179 stop:1964 length:786 start_codon:yes stop_codon:yes gene_type:complete